MNKISLILLICGAVLVVAGCMVQFGLGVGLIVGGLVAIGAEFLVPGKAQRR